MTDLFDVENIPSAYDQLVDALYQGALEDIPWQGFLSLLCQQMQAKVISLILRPPAIGDSGLILNHLRSGTEPTQEHFHLADPKDWQSAVYREQFYALDPFVNLPEGQAMTLAELMPRDELLTSPYYHEYLKPAGVFHILGTDIVEADGAKSRLRISREENAAPFSQRDQQLCNQLIPHLRRAIEIHSRLNRTESERALYASAIDQMDVGIVLLDEKGQILKTNTLARELINEQRGLEIDQQRLMVGDKKNTEQLQQLIKDVIAAQQQGKPALIEAMRIPRDGYKSDLGLIVRPVPTSAWAEGQASPTVAIFISDPEKHTETSGRMISQLFGLSPAESKLSLMLAQGLSLAEASEQLFISQHTARTHLKSIFSKTGATRQAELIRLILKSVASLG